MKNLKKNKDDKFGFCEKDEHPADKYPHLCPDIREKDFHERIRRIGTTEEHKSTNITLRPSPGPVAWMAGPLSVDRGLMVPGFSG